MVYGDRVEIQQERRIYRLIIYAHNQNDGRVYGEGLFVFFSHPSSGFGELQQADIGWTRRARNPAQQSYPKHT